MTTTSADNTSSRRIGYACSYLPEEIVMAAGFIPRRIMPQTRPADADAHIHPNTCHYVKALLAAALEGETPDLLTLIEDAGAHVVALDTCFGVRHYDLLVEEHTGDQMLALATRYLLRSPCPRMHGLERRFEYLKGLVESSGAAGVIYSTVKFCDSHLYDLPLLEEELRHAGIPFLWLENDYEWTGLGQLRTRVEAFLEML